MYRYLCANVFTSQASATAVNNDAGAGATATTTDAADAAASSAAILASASASAAASPLPNFDHCTSPFNATQLGVCLNGQCLALGVSLGPC